MAKPQKTKSKKLTELLHVRLSPEFKAKIKVAFEEGVPRKNRSEDEEENYESINQWIRSLLQEDLKRVEREKKRSN